MLIATIGLYGVMSYMVSRRRVEIGIRMALGAEPRTVVRMVLRESALLLGVGVLAGVGLAVLCRAGRRVCCSASSRGIRRRSRWPWPALGAVSFLAAWIPARRASRLAPTVALRAD